jgi:crotonobetainyl-CoA:carnitine CoA-transferase CaiB-like acyl-CoA transferase
MPGPMHGVRIVDLTQMISGPLGAMILADQGADVIKVEPPTGDNTRAVATERGGMTASFLNNNRNKRSVVLDLKRPGGREALMRLIAGSDVVMQNFRPGVADRLGIGYADARAVRADIVYASICGFGETGPYASKPVFDPLVQSLSGLTTVQAASDDRRPALVRTILPDKLTGFTVAQAIAAALFARERTGQGQHIRLSMLDTVIHFLWSSDMGNHTFVGAEAEVETSQSYIDLIYQTLDGYISVAAFRRRDWERLADAVGRPEWKEDPRFLTSAGLEIHKSARLELTQAALGGRTTAEWTRRLDAYDVPCAPVLTRAEVIRHPQIAANALIVEVDHPLAGRLRQTRPPARFEGTPTEYRMGGPALGQHTREVLAEAGLSGTEIDALVENGAAMQGEEAGAGAPLVGWGRE